MLKTLSLRNGLCIKNKNTILANQTIEQPNPLEGEQPEYLQLYGIT
jgi:hypothetical protein